MKYFEGLLNPKFFTVNLFGAIGLIGITSSFFGPGYVSNEVCLDHIVIPNLFSDDLYFTGYFFFIYGYILTNYMVSNKGIPMKDLIIFLPYILVFAFLIFQVTNDSYSNQWFSDCYTELKILQK